MQIEAGKIVCLNYTISRPDGTLIDSAAESGSWTYVHGETRLPPGLEKGLVGHQIGDRLQLELAPEDAFGVIDPDAFRDYPKTRFPASALHIGYTSEVAGPHGSIVTFRVHAIHEDTVTLDFNHPLAGEHVVFDVTVIHIQE